MSTRTTIKTIDEIDTMRDHDLLVGLGIKFDRMASDIKDLKDGTTMQLVDLEKRVSSIEDIHREINLPETLKRVNVSYEWIRTFRDRWKFLIGIASAVGAIIGFASAVAYHFSGFVPK